MNDDNVGPTFMVGLVFFLFADDSVWPTFTVGLVFFLFADDCVGPTFTVGHFLVGEEGLEPPTAAL